MRNGGSVAAVLIVLAGTGCATSGRASAPGALARAAAPPSPIHWVRDSAEYRAAAVQAYRTAARQLEVLAASRPPGTWAVSLDADETVLDNSQYQKERAAAGLPYTSESWREWVSRKAAPAVPGAPAFLRSVKE